MRVTETLVVASTEIRSNLPELTVSELSAELKRTVEETFPRVRVRGEVSNYRGPHTSGHAYFSLKDEGARIDAVIWKGNFGRLRFKPEEGLEVVATGRITTYAGKSAYQIVIEELEPAGVGALMALLEERKKKLAAEGLFDEAGKKPLPFLPRTIGVVTSPTGAVIRDILHRLSDRFPRHVLVWPVRVQGETCAAEVAAAIEGFNALKPGGTPPRPDVLIVARGGGSLEDLWGFNEEIVARAAAASKIPLVSAVGHETDFTLIDFVSDRRAPTPTAAAELVVPVRADLVAATGTHGVRLVASLLRYFERLRSELRGLVRGIPAADAVLALPRQRLDSIGDRLPRALYANAHSHRVRFVRTASQLSPASLRARFERLHERIGSLAKLIDAFSYHKVLDRGFALVRDAAGKPVRAAAAVAAGDMLDIEFADGHLPAVASGGGPKKKRGGGTGGGQGSLFG
ncbi:MAG TPA: exodeoxyribonuclease VII large subunit [Xanthobacteraceae bacterium]|nr:exodeoxyribonuclease VII large subunit [Xanthobacteraceae bacterium]